MSVGGDGCGGCNSVDFGILLSIVVVMESDNDRSNLVLPLQLRCKPFRVIFFPIESISSGLN